MNEHDVSAIIAVYNGARYLGEAIESVLSQSHGAIDIIVVDDGSTDDTGAVAAGFGARVTVLNQENMGQAAALNRGIAAADSEFVAFLDADDVWEPDKTSQQLARFEARPELGFCVTRIRNFLSPEFEARREELDPHLFDEAPGYVVATLMARRRLFDEVGDFDTSLRHANKTAWFVEARQAGIVEEEIGECLVRRRLHLDNMSQKAAENSVDEYLELVKRSLDLRRGKRAE